MEVFFFNLGVVLAFSQEKSAVFSTKIQPSQLQFVSVLGLELSSMRTTAQNLDLGEEAWATFPALTGKPRATWEVSELPCVWVHTTAN